MNATEILSQEHQIILRMLFVLERIVDAAARTDSLDRDSARDAIEFFQTFADDCHHSKEEEWLFPMLIDRGLPKERGPVSVMLDEHEQGRGLVKILADNVDAAATGDASCTHAFIHAARAFVDLLRDHISKEDNVLFPMAQGFLREDGNEELLIEFEKLEAAHEAGLHARMLELAERLCQRYGVSLDDVENTCGHGGCSDMHHGVSS